MDRETLIARGMSIAVHAADAPDRMAIDGPHGRRSFAELNANCNRLVRLLRGRGLGPGDPVALLLPNRPEFVESFYAALRAGWRVTPVNWHLKPAEAAYIVEDCEAVALIADPRFAETAMAAGRSARLKVRLAVGGPLDGFEDYAGAIAAIDGGDIDDPVAGVNMLYTSGTTGRPKGVQRRIAPPHLLRVLQQTAAFRPDSDVSLVAGPLYHAAPLRLNLMIPLGAGVGCVLMDKWDAEETLRLIERHRATHTHLVPTMFQRMLALPDQVRRRYDLASMRWLLHGAAPCPVETKRRMIEWLGPVLHEYYAASEGGGTYIQSDEWLVKPGSVGRPAPGVALSIVDGDGRALPPGETGTIYFEVEPEYRFVYFKDPEKTASIYRDGAFTLGDMGYLDPDGYLFLTGRSAEVIISGGVNIYPAEIDDVLLLHPAVADVAVVGAPNDEWGEEVRAVVQPAPGTEAGPALAEELIAFCRARLSAYKCPRAIDFVATLPRLETGKVQRHLVRQPYWAGRARAI